MLFWCSISIIWAQDPDVGARRLLLTIIVIASLFLLSQRVGYEASVRIVRGVLPILLLANFIAVLGWPGWAIHQAASTEDPGIVGAWRGILMQKNAAGAFCAYTVIFFALDANNVRRFFRFGIILASTFFLYQTHSKTSMGFLFTSLLLGAAFAKYDARLRIVAILFVLIGASIVGVLAYINWDFLVGPFQNDDFLTGRVQIWPVLIEYSKDHWFLGSGYGSFWNISNPQPIAQYTKGWIAGVSTGHNGYIDLLVQTGIPGLTIAIWSAIVVPIRIFITSLSLNPVRGSLLLASIWFSICHNLTESSLFDRDATVNVFLMLSIFLLHSEGRSVRPFESDWREDRISRVRDVG